MRKLAFLLITLEVTLVAGAMAHEQATPPVVEVTAFRCGGDVARTLLSEIRRGIAPDLRTADVLPCDRAADALETWALGVSGVAAAIVDQDLARLIIRRAPTWRIWKPEFVAQRVHLVALAPSDTRQDATMPPARWIASRVTSAPVKVGYPEGVVEGGAYRLVHAELGHPVQPSSHPGIEPLAAALRNRSIDVAILPGDLDDFLYREFRSHLPDVRVVRLTSTTWTEPVRFTTAGAPYVPVGGEAAYGLIRAERSRGGVTIQDVTHGDRRAAAALRRMIPVEQVLAAGSLHLSYPVLLTRDPAALDRHDGLKSRLAAGFFMAAFRLGTNGGHQCHTKDLASAYAVYFLNAYLAEPSEATFCALWAQFDTASRRNGFPFSVFAPELGRQHAAHAKEAANDPAAHCRSSFLQGAGTRPARPAAPASVACNPPKERGFALQRREPYVHGLTLLMEALGDADRAAKDRKLAEAAACLTKSLEQDATPQCRSFARANWLTFYDPFLPLGLIATQGPK